MSAISITAANVAPGTGAKFYRGYFGATLAAGQVAYRDTTTKRFGLADANDASSIIRTSAGIAVCGGSAGQGALIQYGGLITIGGTVVVGKVYVLGATAGSIHPIDDLVTGWYTSVLGIGYSATQILLGILNGGVAVP